MEGAELSAGDQAQVIALRLELLSGSPGWAREAPPGGPSRARRVRGVAVFPLTLGRFVAYRDRSMGPSPALPGSFRSRAALAWRAQLLLGAVAPTLLTGCIRGFTRAETGAAYNLAARDGHSGQVFSVDTAIGVDAKTVKWIDGGPLPFAVHTSGTAILAPDRKVFGWGTGLAYYGSPRPISGYLLGGTSLHFDEINGKFSFGNVSPYGEIGILTSVPARHQPEGNGLILSLGLQGATYFNYLVKGNEVDGFLLVKLGVGWEVN